MFKDQVAAFTIPRVLPSFTALAQEDSNSHEIPAAYVFRVPMKRWSPFVCFPVRAL